MRRKSYELALWDRMERRLVRFALSRMDLVLLAQQIDVMLDQRLSEEPEPDEIDLAAWVDRRIAA